MNEQSKSRKSDVAILSQTLDAKEQEGFIPLFT